MYKVNEYYSIVYIVYNISFVLVTMYMFSNAFYFCKYYKNKEEIEIELVTIIIFIVIFIFLQILNPQIEFIWIVTASSDMSLLLSITLHLSSICILSSVTQRHSDYLCASTSIRSFCFLFCFFWDIHCC